MAVSCVLTGGEDGTLTITGNIFGNRTLYFATNDGTGHTTVNDGYNVLHDGTDRPNTVDGSALTATTVDLAKFQVVMQVTDTGTDDMELIGSKALRNQLVGGFGSDTLRGAAFADSLSGGSAHDLLLASAGNDTLLGGGGNDFMLGSTGNDTLSGGSGSDALNGGVGNDTLAGGGGNDIMAGGSGIDRFMAEARPFSGGTPSTFKTIADFQLGQDDFDVSALGISDIATVRALVDAAETSRVTTFLNGLSDTYDFSDVNALGLGAGDVVFSSVIGKDSLSGGSKRDDLFGGLSHDTLSGGAGNDRLFGEAGVDQLFSGDGDDLAMGGVGNDWLAGAAGNDSLAGGAGADTLNGNGGKDVLTGDSEADTFRFAAVTDSNTAARDTITDFTPGSDKINLATIDANTAAAGNQAFSFIGTTAFNGTAGQLRFQQWGGTTYVYADTNGDGVADLSIELTGSKALTVGDFIL